MLEIFHSNQTEKLVETLARRIAAQRGAEGGHVLDPVTVVVPNRNLQTYLGLSLAQLHGVSAGLDFVHLESLAAQAAGEGETVRIVDRGKLQAGLLALFHDEARLAVPELLPVRDYLAPVDGEGGEGLSETATDLRRVQLADKLSVLLENHQWTRPEQVQRWLARPEAPIDVEGERLRSRLVWQAALWRALLGPEGVLDAGSGDERRLPHAALASRLLDPEVELILPGEGRPLHLFGISYFGRLFHHLFRRLGQQMEVRIYLLNPTRHYWDEFVVAEGLPEVAETEGEDPLGLADQPSLPLALWGKPGGEHLRLLREIAGGEEGDEDEAYVEPSGEGLLARVQGDLLEARGPTEIEPLSGAALEGEKTRPTLRALSCPSLRREVEAVADRIWDLLQKGEGERPLRFHEIAVVVPPSARERYLPIVSQVFEAHHRLPHTTADLSFASRSPLAQAATLLLELPFGRFTRAALLRAMTHPAFAAGAGLPAGGSSEIDTALFSSLAEAAGIYFGRDDADLAGTYLENDPVHWSQGLSRLALGQSLGGPRSGEAELLYEGAARTMAPEDLGSGDPVTVGAFGLLARGLLRDLEVVRESRLPLREWAAILRKLLTAYLRLEEERDEADLLRILQAIDSLSELDLGAGPVSGRVACALASRALAGQSLQQGPYLAEGVVVSTFLPMRAIPFRAIFVLGLGEGIFPGPARRDPLDLRASRLAGDLSPAERDRHAFLETLLCAREQLCLSFVGRDETTGDALSPSSVLLDLLEVLRPLLPPDSLRLPARGEDGKLQAGDFFELLPLRRHEDPSTALPEALAEREAARRGRADAAADADPLDDPALRLALLYPPKVSPTAETPPASGSPAAGGPVPGTAPRDLLSRQLLKFLDSPLQGAASTRLGLREADEDPALEVEDEPLTLSSLQTSIFRGGALEELLREVPWETTLEARTEAATRILAHAERARLRGGVPRGVFAGAHLRADLSTLLAWRELILAHARPPVRRIHLGRAREEARVEAPRLPALLLGGGKDGGPELALHGVTGLLVGPELDGVHLLGHDELKGVRLLRPLLSGILDHLLLAAADRPDELCPGGGRRLLILGAKPPRSAFDPRQLDTPAEVARDFDLEEIGTKVRSFELAAIEAGAARTLLRTLCGELLGGDHDHLLPIDVAAALIDDGFRLDLGSEAVGEAIDKLRADTESASSWGATPRCAYGPVPDPFSYPWLEVEKAQAALEARFSGLLQLVRETP